MTVANSSRHLQQMRSARLVEAEREGKNVRYRLADESVSAAFGLLRGPGRVDSCPRWTCCAASWARWSRRSARTCSADPPRSEVTLVDVRPVEEYRAGHLPGARSMPLDELPGARPRDPPRSARWWPTAAAPTAPWPRGAAEILRAAGYRARHLDLGVPDLRARSVPVTEGEEPRRASPAAVRRSRSTPRKQRKVR